MNKVTQKQYDSLTKNASPKTKSYKTIPSAFLIGGLICVIGQLLLHFYQEWGLDEQTASTVVAVTLVLISTILTGLNVYDNIAKLGGAGTLVPITGFANAVCAPAMEFKSEGMILGVGAKMFVIAGPVIVYGLLTSVAYGLIVYIFKLL